MDGSREPKDLFPDPAKKMDQQQPNNVPPVKRPRQKGHHFDMLANVQRQPRSDYPADLSMQIQGFYPEVTLPSSDVGRWYPDLPNYPRRDTPVPEPESGVGRPEMLSWDTQFVEVPGRQMMSPPPAVVRQWLTKTHQRYPRPLQPMERFKPQKPREEPPHLVMGHPSFPMETLEGRMATSPFSVARTERDRFMDLANGPPPPPPFDPPTPTPPPGMAVMPQPHVRKMPPQPGSLFAEEERFGYEGVPAAMTANKDWNPKEADAALAGQRLRQSRRSRAPGPNREADLGAYFVRQNGLFDFGCSAEGDRNSGRISIMRERLRRLEHRHSPLEDNREQEGRSSERYRARQPNRERRAPYRGSEIGALMNALGLVLDDDIPANPRETSSGISRMREAMFGIVSSRLPPHLLFSDRDFDENDYEFLCRLDDTVESRKGADDQIINKISLCSFGSGNNPQDVAAYEMDPRCPICLENFAEGVEIRVMPCRHKYHRCCLDKWLKIKAVCPICNMNIKDKFSTEPSTSF